ncbi:MAG TPA: SGNH/GDSL hydrolase family protein [Solirubrobacterales bacterium]|jgi:lysophospholipase L1-like esterase|nr:SGNH/GDSL hydrolase family protein [Solirubrobacterales bacterium]
MSALYRFRVRLLGCVVALAAFGTLAFAPAAGATGVGSTYLALGDSLAYGYHAAQFQEELKEKGFVEAANFDDGYVDDFGKALKLFNPKLAIVNDGCPGETTETFIKGSGVGPEFCAGGPTGTPFPKAFLHHAYPGTQLEDALAVAKEPGVDTITLDLGANDILQFLGSTCGFPAAFSCTPAEVEAEIGHVVGNVGFILGQLRAAAPKAKIVFVSQYNPYPTVLKPEGTGDATVEALNGALKSVAASFGVRFANTARVINYSGTHGGPEAADIPTVCAFTAMCPGGTFNPASPEADIHPTKLGYAAMAGVLGAAYLSH